MKEPFYLTEVVEDGFSLFSLGGDDDPLPDLYRGPRELGSLEMGNVENKSKSDFNTRDFRAPELSSPNNLAPRSFSIASMEDENDLGNIRVAVKTGTVLDGLLQFVEPVRIDGRVNGTLSSTSVVVVGESSEVSAKVTAESVVVYGYLKGVVRAKSRIFVRAGGCLIGNAHTPELVVEQGGVFEGKCTFDPKQ